MPQQIQNTGRVSGIAPSWQRLNLPADIAAVLDAAPSVRVFSTSEELVEASCNGRSSFEVAYDVPGLGRVVEANVVRVRNGISANYADAYVRRRDPDCLVIGDDQPTDKPRFAERFGRPFCEMRDETLDWLARQELAVFAFQAGREGMGLQAVVVAPANAGFFALGLAMLQGILPIESLPDDFTPRLFIFVAPPFRHTHFEGRQVVVHDRGADRHELFSYNLYPGPSAKKGVYGCLIHLGEKEGWVTAHCSTVQVRTPYDNIVTFMHEGASGGGKSEMLEQAIRESDGRLFLAANLVTGEKRFLEIPRFCELHPVTDDMALCHPSLQGNDDKLWVTDAEDAWFLRVNHIRAYATDPHLERLTAQPPVPLLFLNIDAAPDSRAMIWEHTEDCSGAALPESQGDRAAAHRSFGGERTGRRGCAEPGIEDSAVYAREPFVRNPRTVPCTAARAGLAVAAGSAARVFQPERDRGRWAVQRGRRVVLAVRDGAAGGPGQSAAAPDQGEPEDPARSDPESARRGVVRGVLAAVGRARIPGAARQREVPSGATGAFAMQPARLEALRADR